ncbi:hypothetical protein [Streptomyces adelaidensis]|uniref:hypothetical protein n=1 Tax=Streptomyces adelaidensis TaxID=2796465 RepID=UPI0019032C64|nr:hypothetical protein [Streptomyces adelaidensis]
MAISGTHFRAVRAALFTALAVTLSAASHVLLSGVPLPPATVAAIAAAVFAVAYALAGRERGFGRIAGVLIPLELTADTVFTTGQHACYGAAGGPVTGPLRQVGLDLLCGGSVGTPLARVTGDSERAANLLAGAGPSTAWLLLAAHLAVGLLAAAWLRRGERALAQLLDAAVATGFRPLLIAVASVTPRPAPAEHRPTRRTAHRTSTARTLLFAHSLGRRGPPCSVTFA